MDWIWWVGAALALGLVELIVVDVVVLTLLGGAIAGAIAAALGAQVWQQVVVACLTSVILFFTLRPWAMRWLKKKSPLEATGTAAHIGQTATVVMDVTHSGGRIKIGGEVWSAKLDSRFSGHTIAAGSPVLVTSISGATAVVTQDQSTSASQQ